MKRIVSAYRRLRPDLSGIDDIAALASLAGDLESQAANRTRLK